MSRLWFYQSHLAGYLGFGHKKADGDNLSASALKANSFARRMDYLLLAKM